MDDQQHPGQEAGTRPFTVGEWATQVHSAWWWGRVLSWVLVGIGGFVVALALVVGVSGYMDLSDEYPAGAPPLAVAQLSVASGQVVAWGALVLAAAVGLRIGVARMLSDLGEELGETTSESGAEEAPEESVAGD